jgi:hypothetical protein
MGLEHSPRLVTNGLQLCLDAGNTRSYPGSGTTWTDISNNSRNGTLTNGPTFSSGSIVFDGTNDYVDCGSTYSGLFGSGFTCGVWFKVPSVSVFQRLVALNNVANTNYDIFLQIGDDAKFQCGFNGRTGGSTNYRTSSSTISANTWYYMVATNLSSTPNLYINGSLNNGTLFGTTSLNSNFGRLEIGRLIELSINYHGAPSIASVHIYNRELSAAEIRQNFNALRGRFGI